MNQYSGGWTSHKIHNDDYEEKKRAAIAQSKDNAYIQGIQSDDSNDERDQSNDSSDPDGRTDNSNIESSKSDGYFTKDAQSNVSYITGGQEDNSYIRGVQSVLDGVAIENKKSNKYGNSNLMPNAILQGKSSNLMQPDSPGNSPAEDLPNQTGSVQSESSDTTVAAKNQNTLQTNSPDRTFTSNLENRLEKMAKGGQGFPGLNNRNREV